MQSPENCATVTDASRLSPFPEEKITITATSVRAMEELLKYRFKNTKLLDEAFTHSSCPNSANNYQRQLTDLRLTMYVRKSLLELPSGKSVIFDEKSRERERSCS